MYRDTGRSRKQAKLSLGIDYFDRTTGSIRSMRRTLVRKLEVTIEPVLCIYFFTTEDSEEWGGRYSSSLCPPMSNAIDNFRKEIMTEGNDSPKRVVKSISVPCRQKD